VGVEERDRRDRTETECGQRATPNLITKWLACGCTRGYRYGPPAIGDEVWCTYHKKPTKVQAKRAENRGHRVGWRNGADGMQKVIEDPLIQTLFDARVKRGVSSADLRALGLGGGVNDWETGARSPRLSSLQLWAKLLGYRLVLEKIDGDH
jgi:hypothetical protein